jgi:DNA-binding SARP family transcriptional activator/tetratricopeptide (TPR) repeat protein
MLFKVLGPIEAGEVGAEVQGMQRKLLAALLIGANRVVGVANLLDALWGDAQPATATGTLHTHVSRLRSRLAVLAPGARLVTREPGYVLEVDPADVDAARFERLVGDARSTGDLEERVRLYDLALALWRGEAYADFAGEEFARPAAVRLEEMRLSAAEERIEALLGLDRHADVQGDLEGLVAVHPLRERFRSQLMVARYRSGRTVDALDVFRDYREHLAEELGLDPSPALQKLERDILSQDPELDPPEAPGPRPPPPASGSGDGPAAEPERKLVTILLAVLDAPLSPDGDPEDALAAIEPVTTAMRDAVHRYDGTVYRVSSHGLEALFGAPVAQEDHAVRASYAALALLDAVCALGVPVRCALQSGAVLLRTVRTDVSLDYEPVGASVGEAERMLARTAASSVSASAETVRLAAGRVEAREIAPGPDGQRPRRWRLIRAAHRTPFQARTLGGRTAFAGRGAELRLLSSRAEGAAAGHGQIVTVVGEAGVGKSRLCAEFLERAVPRPWTALAAAATPTESRSPYQPLAAMLRIWLGLPDDAGRDAVRAAVGDRCRVLGAGHLELGLLAVFDLAGREPAWVALEPGQRRRRIHTALVDLLLSVAASGPLLLVVEDLHWVDAETAAVLDLLVDGITGAPVLLVVTYRPEHLPPWVNRSHVTSVHLSPLRAGEADRFLSSLLGDDPRLAAFKARLLDWTGGSPLFLEETVSALAEDGVLEGVPGAYVLDDPAASVTVPTSVHAVLSARIDRLPGRQKALLQTAAVIGPGGPIDLLLACVDAPEDEVAGDLAALRQAEFLFERRGAPEPTFAFKHAITHDAVYASLTRAGRRRLHQRVADVIRARHGPGEHLARLGRHALGAEDWAEAARLLRQAAEQALDRSAHSDASELLEQAVEALGHLEATPEIVAVELDVRMALRPAAAARGDLIRALAHLERAEELARQAGDDERLVAIKVHQSFSRDLLGHVIDAVASGEEGLRIATRLGDEVGQAECRLAIAQAYALSGDAPRVLSTLAPSMALLTGPLRFERHGQAGMRGVWALGHSALAHAVRADFARAGALAAEASEVAGAGGRTVDRAFAAYVHGFLLVERGEPLAALGHLEAGTEISTEGEVPLLGTWNRAWLGHALVLAGRTAEGGTCLRALLEEAVGAGALLVEGWARAHLAHLALVLGDAGGAAAEAEAAVRVASRWRHPFTEARALRFLGEASSLLGDADAAEARFAAALGIAAGLGARALSSRTLYSRGSARARAGRRDEAFEDLTGALDAAGGLGLEAWERRVRSALGDLTT